MSHPKSNGFAAANFHQRYVIEVAGEAMGIVVQERGGFRFFASGDLARVLDRRLFGTPGQVEDTCRRLHISSHPSVPKSPRGLPSRLASASGLVA